MFKKIRIWFMKRRAKNALMDYYLYSENFNCGYALTMQTSGRAHRLYMKYVNTIDWLRRNDPNFGG